MMSQEFIIVMGLCAAIYIFAQIIKREVGIVSIEFKYEIGQHVYWNDKLCQILSRSYMETSKNNIIKYDLRCGKEFYPNVWEDELKTLWVVR